MNASRITWRKGSDVEMRSIEFLDYPLLQADAFHLLAGRKGQGKGTWLIGVAAQVMAGHIGEKPNVVWIGSEDSAEVDVVPRLVAAGGDPERLLLVKDGWIQLPRDLGEIERAILELGDVGMVVIDPVANHIAGKDSNTEEVRSAIAPLNKLANDHACMVIGVRHVSEKDCTKGVLAAILGSSAWVQVPRCVLAVARDNENSNLSHVQCVAGNRLPPDTPGRLFEIKGVRVPGLENDVTKAFQRGDSTKDVEQMLTQKKPSKSGRARELLLDALEEQPGMRMESDALDAQIAQVTGLAAGTIKNLRVELKDKGLIKSVPVNNESGELVRWDVVRTSAPRPSGEAT